MLKKIIEGYNKKKLEFIRDLAGSKKDVFNEALFVDDGEIETRINLLKDEYLQVEKELSFVGKYDKKGAEQNQKLRFLADKCRTLREEMAFWASNNVQNLDMCINLVEKDRPAFLQCLMALKAYEEGDESTAYSMISEYIRSGKDFARHFLMNKVFGQMLWKQGNKAEAEQYLYRAQRLRPDNYEVNTALSEMYQAKGYLSGARVCREIANLAR